MFLHESDQRQLLGWLTFALPESGMQWLFVIQAYRTIKFLFKLQEHTYSAIGQPNSQQNSAAMHAAFASRDQILILDW